MQVRDGDYDRSGLLHAYAMELQEDSGVADTVTNENQAMLMPGYNPPTYVPSDAPLATATGEPLIQPYGTNFALQLHDSQVREHVDSHYQVPTNVELHTVDLVNK